MIFVTLGALVITSILAFVNEFLSPRRSKALFVFCGICLIIIAGFRDGSEMPDYATYQGLYDQGISYNFMYLIELSFIYIVKLSHLIASGNAVVLFVIYAILGVSLKLYAITKISTLYFFSLVIYISNYFILQEMIQIRAGVATAFILISLVFVYNRNLKLFLASIGLAIFFHYSSGRSASFY